MYWVQRAYLGQAMLSECVNYELLHAPIRTVIITLRTRRRVLVIEDRQVSFHKRLDEAMRVGKEYHNKEKCRA
jgi:hypothetical protein